MLCFFKRKFFEPGRWEEYEEHMHTNSTKKCLRVRLLLGLEDISTYCSYCYAPFSMPFGLAKIMRPAAVCNTEVTNTPMVSPICFLPLSTTIIVPSSR